MNQPIARLIMLLGIAIFLIGGGIYIAGRFNIPLGRLPGDIRIDSGNLKVYFPITTMIIISIVLTLVLNLVSRFFNR